MPNISLDPPDGELVDNEHILGNFQSFVKIAFLKSWFDVQDTTHANCAVHWRKEVWWLECIQLGNLIVFLVKYHRFVHPSLIP